jgi:hypothetical protein
MGETMYLAIAMFCFGLALGLALGVAAEKPTLRNPGDR